MMRVLKYFIIGVLAAIIGAGAVLWTPDTDAVAMRAKYAGPTSQFVDLGNGLTVHLRDEGPRDGPVIMLLHGSNAFLQTWDGWAERLKQTHRVIRFDLPGHGLTGADPARSYSHAAYADVVDRVVLKLALPRLVLGGNSMGGHVAWRYAHKHPQRLIGLVLVDAAGEPEPDQQDLPLGFRIARTPVLRDVMLYVTPRSLIDQGLRQSVTDKSVVTTANVDRYWELLRYPGNRQATIDRFASPREPAVVGPPRVTIPTLLMGGADDKLIPVASALWFKRQVNGARLIVYRGVGHLPMEEIPAKSAADVANWLASLPKPR